MLDELVNKFSFIIPPEVYMEAVVKGKKINAKDSYSIDEKIRKNLLKVHDILEDIKKEPISKDVLYKVLQIQQLEKEIIS